MDFITLPAAVAFVGSLSVLCLTLIKLIMIRNNGNNKTDNDNLLQKLDEKFDCLDKKVAVNSTKLDELKNLPGRFDKLQDLLLMLFKEEKNK